MTTETEIRELEEHNIDLSVTIEKNMKAMERIEAANARMLQKWQSNLRKIRELKQQKSKAAC